MKSLKLKELILIAVLGVGFAALYLGTLSLAGLIGLVLTPLGLGYLAYELVFGVWFMASTVAAYIIRKAGVATITEVLAAGIEILMGNFNGPRLLISGLIQGVGAEIPFAATRWNSYSVMTLAASGASAAVFSFLWGFVVSGFSQVAPGILLIQLAVRIVSGVLFAGFGSKLICDGLAKTGVLKSYRISRPKGD